MNKRFTILDAPGHKDFIPNMISGATQADVALLVVPGTRGEYESSMKPDSQTREHAVLLKALGVNQIVVVVNKLEEVAWSQERFLFIKEEVSSMLGALQFGPKAVRYVPASGLSGENLVQLSEDSPLRSWYDGPTLLEALDSFRPPPRLLNKPFRAIITSIIREYKQGCDVGVKILQGRIHKGRSVGIGMASSGMATAAATADISVSFQETSQFVADIKKISIDGLSRDRLIAGQNGVLALVDRLGLSGEEMCMREGLVLFKGPSLLKPCKKFKAIISTTSMLSVPVIVGSTYDLYLHGEEIQCYIKKIYSVTRSKTETIKRPKCIPSSSSAVVKIKMEREAYVENFSLCTALGRFALRCKGTTAAVGICKKVYPLSSFKATESTIIVDKI
jgi:elongation factor 1 alpha-like protein